MGIYFTSCTKNIDFMKNIVSKIIIFTLLFTTVHTLHSSQLSFYEIKPYYDAGDFNNLRRLLKQKMDDILSGEISLSIEKLNLFFSTKPPKLAPG